MVRRMICIMFLYCVISTGYLISQVPERMSYQGMLTGSEGETVEDGLFEMHFKLYNGTNPSTELWSETQNISVVNGIFNAILGIVTPLELPFDEQYYLGIAVGDEPEFSPRIALTSSAYSFRAGSIDDGQVVKSINELKDDIFLEAGDNISITGDENKIIISAESTGGSSNITEITAGEGLTGGGSEGEVTLAVEDEGITSDKLASGAVTSSKLTDGSVTTVKLAAGSVNGSKITDGQVVRSINNLTDAVYLFAEGGATVTARNDTLVINAGSGGDGTGIQGIQNTNNTLDIVNSTGPTATINIKNAGVGTQQIEDDAVTSAKLSNDSASMNKISGGVLSIKDGRLGVIENNPRQQLSIGPHLDLYSGSVNNPLRPSIRGSSANNLVLNAFGSGAVYINNDGGSGGIRFHNGTSSGEVMRIHTNGRVGIGTTSPQALLHIGGAYTPTVAGTNLAVNGTMAASGTIVSDQGTILSRADTDNRAAALILDAEKNSGGKSWFLLSHANNSPFQFPGGSFSIYDGEHRLMISSAGRIGIGTGTPESILHLRNNDSEIGIKMKASFSWTAEIRQTNTSRFSIVNGGQERFIILPNGRIGVNEDSPRQQISIGSNLDLYSGPVNNPTRPSIRGSGANNLILNASGGGAVFINNDGGTGGVRIHDGTASGELMRIASNGKITFKPQSSVLNIPAMSFTPGENGYNYFMLGSLLFKKNTHFTAQSWYAPVNLPHGAKVTRVQSRWLDETADHNLEITFMNESTNTVMASLNSSGSGGTGSTIRTNITQPIIDNGHSYYIFVKFPLGFIAHQDLGLYRVIIEYEVTGIN